MARKRRSLADDVEMPDDHVDLTPMLDCVFVLLLFLIIATTFEEDGLFKVTLPTAEQSAPRTRQEVVILTIAADGRYAIGKEFVAERQLLTRMTELRDEGKLKALLIKGDKSAPYDQVVRAVDTAQALGVGEYSFVVAKPE
jgi:biopolymer transport protein ExbD